MTRKAILLTVLVVTGLAVPAAGATGDMGLGEPDAEYAGVLDYNAPEDAVRYDSSGTLSWHVTTTNGSLDTLRAWANESQNRDVRQVDEETNWAIVSAPASAMGVTSLDKLTSSGLLSKSYVTGVSINREIGIPDTPTSPSSENYTGPDLSWGERLKTSEMPTKGIAFSDSANKSTVGDARDVIGSDNVTATGSGTTTAVIDSGVNHGNGSLGLKDKILPESKDFVDNETGVEAVRDPNGHGTWVASAIAADPNSSVSDEEFEGTAPDTDILALRALGDDGSGSTADIVEAIRYAESHNADVIAMSLGSQVYTPEIDRAIKDALDGNVTVVSVAAGNSRSSARWLASPSDSPHEGVIAVAATNSTDPSKAGVASFSQLGSDPGTTDLSQGATTGQQVDVSAPGMEVTAKVADTTNTTFNESLSGTSMAQPFNAGTSAQLLEADSALVNDSAGTADRLRDTARPMPNAATVEAGHGMVAVDRAIADNTTGTQNDAMTDSARARDEFWKSLGGRTTGQIKHFLTEVGS